MNLGSETTGPSHPIDPSDPPALDERWRLLVDAAEGYALFILNPQGIVSTWNQGAARLKGYAQDEIVGRHFSIFYTESDREANRPQEILDQAARDGRAEATGWRVRKDGSQFWANVSVTALRDADGHLRGFAKSTRDETLRREKEELERALVVASEQERIAQTLTDTLVHQLFAIGMELQAALKLIDNPDAKARIEKAVADTDEALRIFRTGILDIRTDNPQ